MSFNAFWVNTLDGVLEAIAIDKIETLYDLGIIEMSSRRV